MTSAEVVYEVPTYSCQTPNRYCHEHEFEALKSAIDIDTSWFKPAQVRTDGPCDVR